MGFSLSFSELRIVSFASFFQGVKHKLHLCVLSRMDLKKSNMIINITYQFTSFYHQRIDFLCGDLAFVARQHGALTFVFGDVEPACGRDRRSVGRIRVWIGIGIGITTVIQI